MTSSRALPETSFCRRTQRKPAKMHACRTAYCPCCVYVPCSCVYVTSGTATYSSGMWGFFGNFVDATHDGRVHVVLAFLTTVVTMGYTFYAVVHVARRWHRDPIWMLLKTCSALLFMTFAYALARPVMQFVTQLTPQLTSDALWLARKSAVPVICFVGGVGTAAAWNQSNGATTRDRAHAMLLHPDSKSPGGLTIQVATLKDLTNLVTESMARPNDPQANAAMSTPCGDCGQANLSTLFNQWKQEILEELSRLLIPIATAVNGLPTSDYLATIAADLQNKVMGGGVRSERQMIAESPARHRPQRTPPGGSQKLSVEAHAAVCAPSELSPYEFSDSDGSLHENHTFVKTVHPRSNRGKKNKSAVPRNAGSPRPELDAELAGLSEAEMLAKLREREQRRREERKQPKFLTDEEKQMTMDELHRYWKVERQRRRNEREDLRVYDFQPLGQLTEEQKKLPRRDVERLIARRREEVWADTMRARGIEVLKCDTCYRLHTGDHSCIATRWRTDAQRHSAVPRGVVVTGTPQGVRVTTAPIIEEERLQKQLRTIQGMLEEIATKKKLTEAPEGQEEPSNGTTERDAMIDVGAGKEPEVPPAQCV